MAPLRYHILQLLVLFDNSSSKSGIKHDYKGMHMPIARLLFSGKNRRRRIDSF
jgi:hypothetical protein